MEKQLLKLRRMKKQQEEKRQGQQGPDEILLEKQLLHTESLRRIDLGERKQPFGPQKLRL